MKYLTMNYMRLSTALMRSILVATFFLLLHCSRSNDQPMQAEAENIVWVQPGQTICIGIPKLSNETTELENVTEMPSQLHSQPSFSATLRPNAVEPLPLIIDTRIGLNPQGELCAKVKALQDRRKMYGDFVSGESTFKLENEEDAFLIRKFEKKEVQWRTDESGKLQWRLLNLGKIKGRPFAALIVLSSDAEYLADKLKPHELAWYKKIPIGTFGITKDKLERGAKSGR